MRAHPADIDDAATALLQRRQAGMHATKGAIEDDIHHLAPFGIAHVADGLFTPERRVVDQNIDAPEPLERGLGERVGSFFIADIAKNGDRFAAALFDLAHDTLGFDLVGANIDDHRSAGPRERKRDCTTDITPGTGNDSDLAGELLVFSHDPRLSPQACQIDFAFVKFPQLSDRSNGAPFTPTAVADVEYKLFPDVGARQGLVC